MRNQNLKAPVRFDCGHKSTIEIKHNVKRGFCEECDDMKHIEHVYVYRAKCQECRWGRRETDQGAFIRVLNRHMETSGHSVATWTPDGLPGSVVTRERPALID